MSRKALITLFVLMLPVLVSSPADAATDSIEPSFTYGIEEVSDITLARSSSWYLDEWNLAKESFSFPNLNYVVDKPDFVLSDYTELTNPVFDTDTFCDCDDDDDDLSYIFVNGTEDLWQFPGNGTAEYPFIIEGYNFYNARLNQITILNTDAFLIIRGNYLSGSGYAINILIENAANIVIEDNTLYSNQVGILVRNSVDIAILNNIISNHWDVGVAVEGVNMEISYNEIHYNGDGIVAGPAQDGVIADNFITYNYGNGITLVNANAYKIINNEITHNQGDGIFLQDSHDNVIRWNNISENGYYYEGDYTTDSFASVWDGTTFKINAGFGGGGLFLDPSYRNEIDSNVISNNAGMGVLLESSDETSISNNNITGNDYTGVFFIDSDSNSIVGNDVSSNGGSDILKTMMMSSEFTAIVHAGFGGGGLFLDPSFDNVIANNSVNDNYGVGVTLEYSEGTTIAGNDIGSNGLSGISFLDSDDNSITGNVVTNNGANSVQYLSKLSVFDFKVHAGFGGGGIFLDPSHGNEVSDNFVGGNVGPGVMLQASTTTTIDGNEIASNGGDGVFFLNSSYNSVSNNKMVYNGFSDFNSLKAATSGVMQTNAGFGGGGLFLDPSDYNNITGNEIADNAATGIYLLESDNTIIGGNSIGGNGVWGVFLENSDDNSIVSNSIDDNGVPVSDVIGLDAGFGGGGLFLDPSHRNYIAKNNMTGNGGDALFVQESFFTRIFENRFINNSAYGVNLDANSSGTLAEKNNFFGNFGESQARDDGSENIFTSNYFDDADNTDDNYDGIADFPYYLDGDANNTDAFPSNIPLGLNFYEAKISLFPRVINTASRGWWVKVWVRLDDGFRVLSVDPANFTLNGTVKAKYAKIYNIQLFKLYFARSEVNDLLDSVGLDHPKCVTLELKGLMNDNLLEVTGYDKVLAFHKERHKHRHHHHKKTVKFSKWFGVAGFAVLTPTTVKLRRRRFD